ncbi:hypothetical protein O6A27_27280 [Escherichia coli]|nr:hypothetical protein [Escherichia coli]
MPRVCRVTLCRWSAAVASSQASFRQLIAVNAASRIQLRKHTARKFSAEMTVSPAAATKSVSRRGASLPANANNTDRSLFNKRLKSQATHECRRPPARSVEKQAFSEAYSQSIGTQVTAGESVLATVISSTPESTASK